jgi:HTH-type transcriptional repressor of NAD biosynthesis genes
MPNVITLLTAIVPTIGHEFLINFCANLAVDGTAHVILCTREGEPSPTARYNAIKASIPVRVHLHWVHGDIPQNPSDHTDFWNVWAGVVRSKVEVGPTDTFVASELYGLDMAQALGCRFVPCDIARQVVPTKGTLVRNDILSRWNEMMPEFRKQFTTTITTFGPESVGKTTLAKSLAARLNGRYVPEWAREYLETVGPEVTDEKMRVIGRAQCAMEDAAAMTYDGPFVVQDTDLLSTIGYYKIYGGPQKDVDALTNVFRVRKSDLYVLLPDTIPFTPDVLRYGVDKRESTTEWWENLLKDFGCDYVRIHATSRWEQSDLAEEFALRALEKKTKPYTEFVRENNG